MFEFLFKYPHLDYLRGELVLTGVWPWWFLVVLAVLAIAGVTGVLWRRRGQVSGGRMGAVAVLQLAMIAVLLVLLQAPGLQTEKLLPGSNGVALVLDRSSSMQYGTDTPRFDTARTFLDRLGAQFEALGLDTHRYLLADDARLVTTFADVRADGNATAITSGLTTVLERARAGSLAGVVLVSDGADTAGGPGPVALAGLAAYGVPVHTMSVGRESLPEDLALSAVALPAHPAAGSTVSARVTIRHDAPATARVRVFAGEALRASVPVALPAGATETTVWLDVEQPERGPQQLRFALDAITGERELRNNERDVLLDVAERDYRVLYYEGEPRWEYKFMRRALAADEELKLVSLLRVSPNKFYRQGLDAPEQLERGFPTTRAELFEYDALIIGSIEAAAFTPTQLDLVHAFVSERGGSLLMLAGRHGLGSGGWGQSSLAGLLPARLPPAAESSFLRRPVVPRLTPQGAAARMLQLGDTPDDNEQAWRGLPALADHQSLGPLRPAARTLLEMDTDTGRRPLLVTQPYGRGHTTIFATSGTWRWQMSLPVEDRRHQTFWRQLVRALVSSAPAAQSLSAVPSGTDDTLHLRAEFRDAEFVPQDDLAVVAVVTQENGPGWRVDLQPSATESGVFTAQTDARGTGAVFVEAVAERDGTQIAAARAGAHSSGASAEYFNLRANPALLRRLATATGGRVIEPGNAGNLAEHLQFSTAGITAQTVRPVWDAPAVFFLLMLLKTAEWWLRRRWRTI